MSGEVDFVVPWVDGEDPEWQTQKGLFASEYDTAAHNGVSRYRTMGLMRYWFRGVEQNAPWVRKIHFITWGHLPEWLDTTHPKLHIVNHRDYIPKEYLPTFSSHPIELNIHRIESLSERFVYFNDDVFLVAPVTEQDYFKNEKPCDEIKRSEHLFTTGSNSFFAHIPFSDLCVINRHFSGADKRYFKGHWLSAKYPFKVNLDNFIDATPIGRGKYYQRFHDFHISIPLLKSVMQMVWDKEGALLSETSSHKTRTPLDVNIWLFRYFQLAMGLFEPKNMEQLGKCFTLSVNNEKLFQTLKNRAVPTICINDTAKEDVGFDFDAITQELHDIFEQIFPNKSSFEQSV